jgi:CRISPR/Cas system CSM-associated protein Csm3 (group 7 of RAMP superfamily)
MARKISHKLELKGVLVALSPLHIGGAEEGLVSDMPLAVDGLGRPYLPGTSLGGAIRTYTRAAEQDLRWGFAGRNDTGSASQIVLDDAPALGAPLPELWHGNGIDRRTGGTFEGIKYDREVLPQGSAFDFRLSLEVCEGQDADEHRGFLAWLAQELEAGRIALGAAGTRGLGRVRLIGTHCRETDWGSPEGILAWVRGPGGDCRSSWNERLARYAAPQSERLRIEVHWHPKGPLMSKAARDGLVPDAMPFLSRRTDGRLALALPGAGIKGAWRSHAERIVRTVLGLNADAEKHHEQVEVPIAADLFGRARPQDTNRATGAPPSDERRLKGRLGFDTCYADLALPEAEWDRLERDENLWRSQPGAQRPMSLAMHVAVDRWTGGAAESLLYSTVEPAASVRWEPLALTFDASADAAGKRPLAELALVWLALRDFCAGRIPLGYGVNRGYGDLAVERIRIVGLKALGFETDEAELGVLDGAIVDESPLDELLNALGAAWTARLKTEEDK